MNPFALSGLLAGISSASIGVLVLLKSTNKKLGRVWFLFALSVAGWGFGGVWIGHTKSIEEGLLAWRVAYAFGVIWIPVLFYHFVCTFIGLKRSRSILIHYLIGLSFISILPTTLFFSRARWAFNSFYYGLNGPLYPFHFTWWMGLVLYSHYELIRAYKRVTSDKKNQIKYFFLATSIGFTGGSLGYLPNFGVDLYPWGNFTVFLYPIIMSYAILRYRLMDVSLVVKRVTLIVLIYSGLALLIAPIAWPLYPIIATSKWGLPIGMLVGSVILSVGPFLYAYLTRKSAFFQERVVSGVTHEFKSPLAAIQSASDILMGEVKKLGSLPSVQGKMADYLLMIQNNSQRLEKFIQDLLQVAKIEQGKPELRMEETDLKELCQRTVELYKPLAQQKSLEMKLVANGVNPVLCDPDKMQMVISNLLSNAVKFTEEGSIEVWVNQANQETTVIVKDTGQGIPKEDIPHIFDKFYQGKNGNGTKGTGLGLSIVKGWVEAHGGRVWVESGGKGTMFTLALPRREALA